jgi:hypothetical protein
MNWNVRQKGFTGLLYCHMLGQVLISRILIRLLRAIIFPLITFFYNCWIHFSQFLQGPAHFSGVTTPKSRRPGRSNLFHFFALVRLQTPSKGNLERYIYS